MNKRYSNRENHRKTINILGIPLFFIFAFAAIKLGVMGGDLLFSMDAQIVRSIDAESFKATLNKSFPLIDTVYNSGNISVSFSGEVKRLVSKIFGFDLSTPITILNAQSPVLYSYYKTDYQSYIMAQREKQSSPKNEGKGAAEHKPLPGNIIPEMKEDASSISFNEENEEKDLSNSNTITSGAITVLNETDHIFDIDKLLKEPLNLKTGRKGPSVLIVHTHTTEAYIRTLDDLSKKDIPSWNRNERLNVVRVGEELAQHLRKKHGIEVIHNGTVHDYPSYNAAYGRSFNTIDSILKSYPSIKVVLDIHRDGLSNEEKLRLDTKINGKNAAKIMFVIGTDSDRLPHPKWRENLKFALNLQKRLNEKYPGLTRHIYISRNRYNQHLSEGGIIVEIGGDGNTLDEALESTSYLADVISEVIK
ncbi:MAG: stage II sporulation protein P [Acetivibrionales bacterium]|jgi:stage II sporulation protein P